jgi:predicted metal-dependent peptidase
MSKTPSTKPSTITNQEALKNVKKMEVSEEEMKRCLSTAMYELTRDFPFIGSTLQTMSIIYSYMLPTAGVTFNAEMKKYEMYINPYFFCMALTSKQRCAVLMHEMYHIINKHLIRVPFMKMSSHKRQLMNVAGDISINQMIKNLPRGCNMCPPMEEQKKGTHCENPLCPGMCMDVNDFYDENRITGKKTPWMKNQTMEFYFEKLLEQYEDDKNQPDTKNLLVSVATTENIDVTSNGSKNTKKLTYNSSGSKKIDNVKLTSGTHVLVKDQENPIDNGIYAVSEEGGLTKPTVLTRIDKHNGATEEGAVKMGDICVVRKGDKNGQKAWGIKGQAGVEIDVDEEDINWEEVKVSFSNSKSKGTPRQFDSHDWSSAAEESDVLDATEDLVKRSLIKQGLSYSEAPSSVQDLLESIKKRKSELDYKKLILSAIKRSASGHDRKSTWTRKSRRFGNLAPGTKEGNLPRLSLYLDTSGSISIEELNEFLDIVDEFLRVGSRKCDINLFSEFNYFSDKYKLGDRSIEEKIKKNIQMGGTDLKDSLEKIYKSKSDLNIIITDGCYPDVEYETFVKFGSKFPQVLWVISKYGRKDHPINRLGKTIKIPN